MHEGKRVLRDRIGSIVTDMKKLVDGIPCVVVWERDFSVGTLRESELFFAAHDDNKNVWLFGEFPAVYEGAASRARRRPSSPRRAIARFGRDAPVSGSVVFRPARERWPPD